MANLVLHVGPGKCGSSTIQHFFATQKSPCLQKVCYKKMDVAIAKGLKTSRELRETFHTDLIQALKDHDTLILSHEFLFQNPDLVYDICSNAKNLFGNIIIIGYSRQQSSFLASAYSQWLFRSPERVEEVNKSIKGLGLSSSLFTGLERQFIASIDNDFYSARQLSGYSILDWNQAYNNISEVTNPLGVIIKCGELPSKSYDFNLIKDFCTKAKLTLRQSLDHEINQAANPSFHSDIVEMINNAIVHGRENLPNPHKKNNILSILSANLKPVSSFRADFLQSLKCYVDNYYWRSNQALCRKYQISPDYFKPTEFIDKSKVMDIIITEGQYRTANQTPLIDYQKALSASITELCTHLGTQHYSK